MTIDAISRRVIRKAVQKDDGIDLVIIRHTDGSNDIFSSKPEVEKCERLRVIDVCLAIARELESTPSRRGPGPQKCPGSDTERASACPTGWGGSN